MKILILGNSSIFRRKIYYSLKSTNNLTIEIASKSKRNTISSIKYYNSYEVALRNTDAKIVYISLINSDHLKWGLKALNYNKHVIIDKPFTTNLNDTKIILNLANKKKLFISEAIVFHKQSRFINLLNKINYKKKIIINTYFHIPKFEKNNFRNYRRYGGGGFQDMSPYAAYLIYLFFNKKKYRLDIRNKKSSKFKEFSFIAKNNRICLNCSFKFNSEYKNIIIIHNNSKQFHMDFAFSPPTDKANYLNIFDENKKKEYKLKFKKQNIFNNYFSEVFKLIKKNKYNFYYNEIKRNAEIRQKIS